LGRGVGLGGGCLGMVGEVGAETALVGGSSGEHGGGKALDEVGSHYGVKLHAALNADHCLGKDGV
jgi:hypothetical protein